MPDDRSSTRRLTKATLVTVSHAIERAGLAMAEDGPMVMFAMFQRRVYFDRESAVYERLSKLAVATVVGVTSHPDVDLPGGPDIVELDEREELAREWSVVMLTPRSGAVLVARDREELDPAAQTLEGGRLFDSWWGFRRDDAFHEVIRLRRSLDPRLPVGVGAVVDGVLDRVRELPAGVGEARVEAAARLLVDTIERGNAKVNALRAQVESGEDQADVNFLHRWTSGAGVTASSTLPLALIGVHITHGGPSLQRVGRRTGGREMVGVLKVLQDVQRPADRLVRLSDEDLLLVMPSMPYEEAIAVAHRIIRTAAGLVSSAPFVAVKAHAVVMVTRKRPLPVDDVRQGLSWAVRHDVAVASLGDQPQSAGESR